MQTLNQSSSYEPEFQAEGEIILTGEKSSGNKKPFIVARKGRQWKIRTTELNFETPFFQEMGCDGTTIYELFQYDEDVLYRKRRDLKNALTATGRIYPGSHPLGVDCSYSYPLWLAFCSSDYFSSRKDSLIISPETLERDECQGKSKPAKWRLNESSLPSRVEWYSKGKDYGFPPPFDGEYVSDTFEVTGWCEFSKTCLPGSFELKMYFPNHLQEHPDPAQGEFCLLQCIVANVKSIQRLPSFSSLPELTRKTLIIDGRFRGGCNPDGLLSYGSSVWMTMDEVEAKNNQFGVKCEKQIPQD